MTRPPNRIALIPPPSGYAPPVLVTHGPLNTYIPASRMVVLRLDASPYERFHELAHAQQHRDLALCYVLWRLTRWLPWIRRFTTMLVEEDARMRALEAMRDRGEWSFEAMDESRAALDTYRAQCWRP